MLVLGVIPPHVQDPTLALVEPHQVFLCPAFQPIKVPLNGSMPGPTKWQHSGPVTPHSLKSSANLLRLHPIPSSKDFLISNSYFSSFNLMPTAVNVVILVSGHSGMFFFVQNLLVFTACPFTIISTEKNTHTPTACKPLMLKYGTNFCAA